ncbi:hypothetical protein ACTWLT_13370 [Micromonospora sp. ZYX-F-536]
MGAIGARPTLLFCDAAIVALGLIAGWFAISGRIARSPGGSAVAEVSARR